MVLGFFFFASLRENLRFLTLTQEYYTPAQLKMPAEMERIMEVDDPVYSFSEVLRHMAPQKVFCGGRGKGASHMTICNLIHHQLEGGIEEIFPEISQCRFEKEAADLEHIDIDGTRTTASASRYSWVWRKSCGTDRRKVSGLLMNCFGIKRRGVKFGVREAYAIEYLGIHFGAIRGARGYGAGKAV